MRNEKAVSEFASFVAGMLSCSVSISDVKEDKADATFFLESGIEVKTSIDVERLLGECIFNIIGPIEFIERVAGNMFRVSGYVVVSKIVFPPCGESVLSLLKTR
jgi:hypothetical protein